MNSTARLAWIAAVVFIVIAAAAAINRYVIAPANSHPAFGAKVALVCVILAVVCAVYANFNRQAA